MVSRFHIGAPPAEGDVTVLQEGAAYYEDLAQEMARLQEGDRLFLMNWHINPARRLPIPGANPGEVENLLLGNVLMNLHSAGVDVRVLLWVNTNMLRPLYSPMVQGRVQSAIRALAPVPQMRANVLTLAGWRKIGDDDEAGNDPDLPRFSSRLMVNTLDAFSGGCHAKFALTLRRQPDNSYLGTGYTGGIDFGPNRDGYPRHGHVGDFWHDLQAKVTGPEAIGRFIEVFREAWNENIARRDAGSNPVISMSPTPTENVEVPPFRCVPEGADVLEIEDISLTVASTPGKHSIQSLRTVPKIIPGFGERPISFAPDGAFEFRRSLRHAIATAQTYIYIEDQAMESLEIFDMLREALNDPARPNLRVILLTGTADPDDGPRGRAVRTLLAWYFHRRVNVTARARFHFYEATSYVVHSKVFLFDDEFAIVGSAGMFTRSLTTEYEHAVGFAGQSGTPDGAPDAGITTLRENLWAELLQLNGDVFRMAERRDSPGSRAFAQLSDALQIWDATPPDDHPHGLAEKANTLDRLDPAAIVEAYMPILAPAAVPGGPRSVAIDLLDADTINAVVLAEKNLQPGEFDVIFGVGVYLRSFDMQARLLQFVHGRTTGPNEEDFLAIRFSTTNLPEDGTGALPAPGSFTFDSTTLTDPRLEIEETAPATLPNGAPLLKALQFPLLVEKGLLLVTSLRYETVLVSCIGGVNTDQIRVATTTSDGALTCESFEDADTTNFDYELFLPKVREVRLARYREDARDVADMMYSAGMHLLTHELPYLSFFNEDRDLPLAMPMPVGRPYSPNEIVPLKTLANDGASVAWACSEPDASPASGTGVSFNIQFATPGTKKVIARQTLADGTEIPFGFTVEVMRPSGPDWFHDFKPPPDVDDLISPFKELLQAFRDALAAKGISSTPISVYRPPERAYLMHQSFKIACGLDPREIDMSEDLVRIGWRHYRSDGSYDADASVNASTDLAVAYNVYKREWAGDASKNPSAPAYPSNHTKRIAADLAIDLEGISPVLIPGPGGQRSVLVAGQADLTALGRLYGLTRYNHNSNHWVLARELRTE